MGEREHGREPEWRPVASSNLEAVRWGRDEEGPWLDVRFLSGRTARYSGVPEAVSKALLAAESKGKFHAREIKHRYPFRYV